MFSIIYQVPAEALFRDFCCELQISALETCTTSALCGAGNVLFLPKEHTPYCKMAAMQKNNWCKLHGNKVIRASLGGIRITKLAS